MKFFTIIFSLFCIQLLAITNLSLEEKECLKENYQIKTELNNLFPFEISTSVLNKISQEYSNNPLIKEDEKSFSIYTIFQWGSVALVFFMGVILAFFLNNRKMQKEIKRREKLEEDLSKYLEILDNHVIILNTDLEGIITEVSQAFCNASGYQKEELIGKPHPILGQLDTKDTLYSNIKDEIKQNKFWKGEILNKTKDGRNYWVKATISSRFDSHGKKTGYTSIKEDITDKKSVEKLSITDSLTEIYNRRYFDQIIEKELKKAKIDNLYFSLVIIDIDYFKQYNDTYGHQKGDIVLIEVAKVLKNSAETIKGYYFRLGGEEFGLLFSNFDKNKSLEFAEELRKDIEKLEISHKKNEISPYITVSLGLSCEEAKKIKNTDNFYKNADDNLYEAKKSGKNRTIV